MLSRSGLPVGRISPSSALRRFFPDQLGTEQNTRIETTCTGTTSVLAGYRLCAAIRDQVLVLTVPACSGDELPAVLPSAMRLRPSLPRGSRAMTNSVHRSFCRRSPEACNGARAR